MNTNDVLNKLKGKKSSDGNERRYHNNLLVPFLRLKAMNRGEHDSWILVLKQTVNKSITQAISQQKHGMPAHGGAGGVDNYVRISSPILQKIVQPSMETRRSSWRKSVKRTRLMQKQRMLRLPLLEFEGNCRTRSSMKRTLNRAGDS